MLYTCFDHTHSVLNIYVFPRSIDGKILGFPPLISEELDFTF